MMDKVQKPCNSECYTPSSESIRYRPIFGLLVSSYGCLDSEFVNNLFHKVEDQASIKKLLPISGHHMCIIWQYLKKKCALKGCKVNTGRIIFMWILLSMIYAELPVI
jgi:hypothetical protein